jgi:hypothetical protein
VNIFVNGEVGLLHENEICAPVWRRAKAVAPMVVTPLPIETLVTPEQRENAPIPMLVTELGIVRLVNSVQPLNALAPMLVTELGIVRLVNPEQF